MNEFCTNCGKKLEENELKCKNCDVPIIDVPYNYYHKTPLQKEKTKKRVKIVCICVLSIILFCIMCFIISRIKPNRLKRKFVEPYLKENYKGLKYSIKYDYSEKCIISGDCYISTGGCDGTSCDEYEFADDGCKSYYYNVEMDSKKIIITVAENGKNYKVVEGRNINDSKLDKEDDESEDFFSNEEQKDEESDDGTSSEIVIKNYPYESNYFNFKEKNNQLYLDNNGTILNFFSGILNDNSKLYVSGNVTNPKYFEGNIYMNIKYYDEGYQNIGSCNDTIKLLGKGYSSIDFSCHISEHDMLNNKNFKDVVYYKIIISNMVIDE